MMDYYATLGIEKTATQKEVSEAYRKLARMCHPDVNPSGAEEFKKITKAFEVLNNPTKRSEYDRYGAAGGFTGNPFGQGSPFGFGGFPNAEDLFRDIFTQGSNRTQQERGADVHVEMNISLEEIIRGCKKEIPITNKKKCDQCENGALSWNACSACNGTGHRTLNQRPFIIQTTCNVCGGKGKVITAKCSDCSGTGFVDDTVTETVEFEIPAGVDEGMQVRLAGKGQPGGDSPGDMYVRLRVVPHVLYKRKGNDLYCFYLLPYAQLILGTTVTVPLCGEEIEVIVPSQTQSGTKIRVPGKGIKGLNNHQVGHLFVEIQADTSDTLTPDLINLLAEQERQFPSTKIKKFEETLLHLKEIDL